MTKIFNVILFVYLSSNVLKVDTTNNETLSVSGYRYLFEYPPECITRLNAFATSASNFTMCSIQYARPVRLCEKCIEQYLNVSQEYNAMVTMVVNGTSCKSIFISQDRLDAVLEFYDNILNIWNKGNCNDCYDWTNSVPILSKKTIEFNSTYNETKKCIYENSNSEVCEKCMQTYLQLDNYYKTLSNDSMGLDSVCMDIVDSMNTTRSIWSKTLNCCKVRKSPEIIFLCCTTIISILPLLYYLVLRYFGQIKNLSYVLRQSRFKQRILRTVNSRAN